MKSSGKVDIHSYHNQALYGFSYRNITTSSMQECLQHCLSDCLCQTFQICGNTCQLCSNLTGSYAGRSNSAAVREAIGCNRFEFEHRNNLYVSYLKSLYLLYGVTLIDFVHTFYTSLLQLKHFSVFIYSYIYWSGSWKNEKLCGSMFLVFVYYFFSFLLLPVRGLRAF